MSKKEHLLTENQVRQFMKLANLQPLSSGFVNGLTEKAAFDKGQQTEVGGKADESPTKGQDKEDGDKAYEDLEEGTEGVEADAGYGASDPREARPGARLREEEGYDEFEEENAEDDLEHAEDLEMDAAEDMGDVGLDPMGGGREVSV